MNCRIERFTKIYVNKGKQFLLDLVMFFFVVVHDDVKVISLRRKIAEILSNHMTFLSIIVFVMKVLFEKYFQTHPKRFCFSLSLVVCPLDLFITITSTFKAFGRSR